MKAAGEIVKEARERRGQQSGRTSAYDTFLGAYFEESLAGDGSGVTGSNADGRPVLRLQQAYGDLSERRGAPNLLSPMIDDIVSMRGIMPTSTVIPESQTDADTELSVRRTRALRQQHVQSNMDIQLPEAAFYLACLGDAVFTLDPLLPDEAEKDGNPFRPPGIYIRTLNPKVCFPKFMTATDPHELDDLYVVQQLDKGQIKETYGIDIREEKAEVVVYYSRKEKQIIVAGERVSGIEHKLGFCPAQWPTNKVTDGRHAQSDISRAVELHKQMQAMYHIYSDSLVLSVYPMIHVHNPQSVAGDQIEIGPGAVVETSGDGNVNLLPPAANPRAAEQIFQQTFDNIMKIVGIAPVRIEGQIDRSNVSARSVSRQQEGMHNRFELANTVLGFHMERLNAKILLMLYRIPEIKEAQMSTHGVDKDGSFHEIFTGNDMGGWHRNVVKWDAWAGADKHERLVMALQLMKERLISGRRVLEEWGDDDPERTLHEAEQFQAALQQMMAAPPGAPPQAAPAPGGPGGVNPEASPGPPDATQAARQMMALGQGALGNPGGSPDGQPGGAPPAPPNGGGPAVQPAPPPAQLPGFESIASAPTRPGLGSPTMVPDVGQIMDEAIARVPLKGRILARHPIPGGIYVSVTDHRDIGPLKQALRDVAREIGGEGATVKVEVPRWYSSVYLKPARS